MREPRASAAQAAAGVAQPASQRAARFGALVIAGVVIYVALDIVAQYLPPHYNPIRQPESDLGVGPYGWIMSLNFVVRGAIALALLVGLRCALAPAARPRLGLILLLVWATGDVLLAVFRTDIPPHRATIHGVIHLLVAFIAFVAVALSELILSLRLATDPHWAAIRPFLLGLACAALVAMVALFLHVLPRAQIGGLIERLFLGLVLLWMVVAGLWLLRTRAT
jgi:hypothetical protein